MPTAWVPQDPDFEERIRSSFAAQAMMATLGAELVVVEPGRVEIEFAHRQDLTQQHGFVHAGAIATALDSACGYAGFSLMASDREVLTVEYKINLLRPAQAGRYRAVGEVTKAGRTLTVCQGAAYAVGRDAPLASMTATLMALDGEVGTGASPAVS